MIGEPRVELFCRRPRLGWDSWGYGYESKVASPVAPPVSREAQK